MQIKLENVTVMITATPSGVNWWTDWARTIRRRWRWLHTQQGERRLSVTVLCEIKLTYLLTYLLSTSLLQLIICELANLLLPR